MTNRFLAAVQFLTLLPAGPGGAPASGVAFFPIVGAFLGLAAGGFRVFAGQVLPASIAALLALGFLIVATGALHEDGFADVFDAFRAGRSPERILAILKDSRIGVYGAVALVMSMLLRWQAIEFLGARSIAAMPAAVGTSRGVIVVFAAICRPSGDGLGKAFCHGLSRSAIAVAALVSAALLFLGGPVAAVVALCANALVVIAARNYFHRRLGGITGDCIGAVCQVSEIITLLVFICPVFF
jgi:adenosylcobinamide-GDP ribazoletransferase